MKSIALIKNNVDLRIPVGGGLTLNGGLAPPGGGTAVLHAEGRDVYIHGGVCGLKWAIIVLIIVLFIIIIIDL